ncbi:hypothetical protein JCM12298_08620 [Desulfothermus naphthae]
MIGFSVALFAYPYFFYITRLSSTISIGPLKRQNVKVIGRRVSENAHNAIRAFNKARRFKERSNTSFVEDVKM